MGVDLTTMAAGEIPPPLDDPFYAGLIEPCDIPGLQSNPAKLAFDVIYMKSRLDELERELWTLKTEMKRQSIPLWWRLKL